MVLASSASDALAAALSEATAALESAAEGKGMGEGTSFLGSLGGRLLLFWRSRRALSFDRSLLIAIKSQH
jgi:hypothetical protein